MNTSTPQHHHGGAGPVPRHGGQRPPAVPLRRAARVKHTRPKASPMARDQPMAIHKKMPHRNTADAINISISALSCLTGQTARARW